MTETFFLLHTDYSPHVQVKAAAAFECLSWEEEISLPAVGKTQTFVWKYGENIQVVDLNYRWL